MERVELASRVERVELASTMDLHPLLPMPSCRKGACGRASPSDLLHHQGDNDHLLEVLGYSHRGTYAAWDGGRRLSPALASDLDFVLIILIDPCKGRILALSFEG